MPLPRLHRAATEELKEGFRRVRERLEVPDGFPDHVTDAAADVAASGTDHHPGRSDHRAIDFVTIDPPGSRDLDQAVHAEARRGGHRVRYAIADVAALIHPTGPIADEAAQRGVTLYSPGHRAPLHPVTISEGAASLLADVDRPALLWTMDIEDDGTLVDVAVERSIVRSRAQLTYQEVQRLVDAGEAGPSLERLRPIGEARRSLLRAQGGISLHLPDQEIAYEDGAYHLFYDAPLPVEQWNEQISLLTGMAAASIMLDAGVGILRTLPRPQPEVVRQLGHSARALGIDWSDEATEYAAILEHLDPAVAPQAALISESARLFRGASYEPFTGEPPKDPAHHAIGGPYAHVTAPLRRLVDRYTNEIALAVSMGDAVPSWVGRAFEELPGTMAGAKQHQGRLDRASVDYMEAMVLRDRIGETFRAVVTAIDEEGDATVQLTDPAVITRMAGDRLEAGSRVDVRLASVDEHAGAVVFTPVSS